MASPAACVCVVTKSVQLHLDCTKQQRSPKCVCNPHEETFKNDQIHNGCC